MKKYSNVHYHPDNKNIKISYNVEYTEKDEQIREDFSNLKLIDCTDLEEMITTIIKLKLNNRYNIGAYLIVDDTIKNQWLLEDGTGHCLEEIKLERDLRRESELRESLNNAADQITEYEAFLKEYNAEKLFKEWKEKREEKTA